ncbi:formate dehydrogenase accessory protein FdhE [Neisseriaceae bacterium CLB008]
MAQTTPISTPEKIAQSSSSMLPDFYLKPDAAVFQKRAARFNSLAQGHELADFLSFLGHIAQAQHDALATLADLAQPSLSGLVPYHKDQVALPHAWLEVLQHILNSVTATAPSATQSIIESLQQQDEATLNAWATAALSDDEQASIDKGSKLFILAALQVIWTQWALHSAKTEWQALDYLGKVQKDSCPCCGSQAVASVIKIDSKLVNLRYVHCPLCQSQWNMIRARCTYCDSNKNVALHSIAEQKSAPYKSVQAESCHDCHGYRKVFSMSKDQLVDPIADDVASLALDLLMNETEYARGGANPFILV